MAHYSLWSESERREGISAGMEQQLFAAIKAGDLNDVKRILRDQNLIHRIKVPFNCVGVSVKNG